MISFLKSFQQIKPKYFQLFPLIIGLTTIFVTILIFCVPTVLGFDKEEQDAILSSRTMESISSQSFRYILCVSAGVLIPFSTDHFFMLPSLLKFDILLRMESYMLPILVIIMQSFNICFLSFDANDNEKYFWVYYMGTYIQFAALLNAVLAIQANLAQKSLDVCIAIVISALATNIGIILKICFLVQQLDYYAWQQYIWVAFCGVATICNLYIARSWWLKYQVSQKTGLKNQPDIYAFCKIMTLTCFLIAYNIQYLVDVDRTNDSQLLNNHEEHVSTVQALLVGYFFIISEISYHRTKDMARMSMEALETKRNFVRYVSHEIRTPLNTAILGLQLLEKEVLKLFSMNGQRMTENVDNGLKSVFIELVADTHQACNVAVEILNDLLMYEKIDGGLMVLDASEVEVVPFVKETLKMFVVHAKALNLDLIWKTDISNDIFVTIDSYKMSQVIRNIVSNGLKFSKTESKVTVSIEIIDKSKRFRTTKSPMLRSPSGDNNDSSTLMRFISNETTKMFASYQPPSTIRSDDALVENLSRQSGGGDIEQHQQQHHQSPRCTLENSKTLSCLSSSPPIRGKHQGSILQKLFPASSLVAASSKPVFPMLSRQNLTQASSYDEDNTSRADVIRISVHDEGAGISKENQKRLFNEIVQFDAAKLQQGKGSGIGLWISNKIMKLHGGSIGVYSEGEGCGSTFYVDIPICRIRQRHVRSHNLYYQDLANGVSLVHNRQPNELDELDASKAGDASSVGGGGGSMGGWFLHREVSNLSNITGGNADNHSVGGKAKKKHNHSFIAKIANVFGKSSSSSNSSAVHQDVIGAHHSSPNVGRGLRKQPSLLPRPSSSKVGVLNECEPHIPSISLSHKSASHNKAEVPTTGTKRITNLLIVDDSAVNRKMLKRSLIDIVDCIDEAKNGKDCLEQMQRRVTEQPYDSYDIIIMDYYMPEMNGLEAVQILRKTLGYTGMVIGLTGNTESTMIDGFKQAGANVVLTKPFQGSELIELIQGMLKEIAICKEQQSATNANQHDRQYLLLPSSKELSFSDMP